MRGRWGIALAMLVGCGGSTVSPGGDAGGADAGGGVDSGFDAPLVPFDSGHPGSDATADVGTVTKPYDGTTGLACTTDSDCQPPGGPGIALCSPTVFTPETYYPTSVCILPTCSPVSGTTLHYCDGPDDPSSPGICVPQQTGGICLPKCTFDKAGSPAVGCIGKDACDVYTSNTAGGVGYCWAGCTKDGDCATGQAGLHVPRGRDDPAPRSRQARSKIPHARDATRRAARSDPVLRIGNSFALRSNPR